MLTPAGRRISVSWPDFHDGRGIQAGIQLYCPPEHESMTIIIPIANGGFTTITKSTACPPRETCAMGISLKI
jgi:hypothetical protein